MTIDLSRYRRAVKPDLKGYIDRNPGRDPFDLISIYSPTSSCHIIAVSYYYAELYGMTPELNAFISRQMHYYHVTRVDGQLPV
jgi:hypothetical protein